MDPIEVYRFVVSLSTVVMLSQNLRPFGGVSVAINVVSESRFRRPRLLLVTHRVDLAMNS